MGYGLRDFVVSISPPWLATGVAEKYLYGIGLVGDALLEKLNEGMRAHIPTYGDASALPIIGADRLIPRGLTDTDASYAKRLQRAFDDWQIAGSSRSILRQLLGYVAGAAGVRARIVSQSSAWDTYTERSDTTQAPAHFQAIPANWSWDALRLPPVPQSWARIWGIVYSTASNVFPQGTMTVVGASNTSPIVITTARAHQLTTGNCVVISGVGGNTAANASWRVTVLSPSTFSLDYSPQLNVGTAAAYTSGGTVNQCVMAAAPTWGTSGVRWGNDAGMSIGLMVPPTEIASMKSIVAQWKGAHSSMVNLIVSLDDTLFDPAFPSGGSQNPDGNFGLWAKVVANVYVPARFANARYCDGVV